MNAAKKRGMSPSQTVEKPMVLERAAFLASRLLNHSRFPDGRAHGFAALANIGVLRAGRAQPLYLLTPPGRFALRATAHRADASLRCRAGGEFAPRGANISYACGEKGRRRRTFRHAEGCPSIKGRQPCFACLSAVRKGQNALKTGWKSGIILGERMRYTDVSRLP